MNRFIFIWLPRIAKAMLVIWFGWIFYTGIQLANAPKPIPTPTPDSHVRPK